MVPHATDMVQSWIKEVWSLICAVECIYASHWRQFIDTQGNDNDDDSDEDDNDDNDDEHINPFYW